MDGPFWQLLFESQLWIIGNLIRLLTPSLPSLFLSFCCVTQYMDKPFDEFSTNLPNLSLHFTAKYPTNFSKISNLFCKNFPPSKNFPINFPPLSSKFLNFKSHLVHQTFIFKSKVQFQGQIRPLYSDRKNFIMNNKFSQKLFQLTNNKKTFY